jgi:hypothetical protein
MPNTDHERAEAQSDLTQALDLLRQSQEMNRVLAHRTQRLQRRMRRQILGVLIIGLIAVVSVAMATSGQQFGKGASDVVSPASPDRERLLAMLSDEQRADIEHFEAKLQWLSAYMKSSSDFDAGAAVALFLSELAQDMTAVPKMHSEMQIMNTRMAAVPAIVAEMQAINAKMAVMTGAMDSTMGRAGRMFPWMPFSP